MTKREMTLVYYHVPEDKDDPECPNVYGVPASKHSINLATIYQSFPLKGSYLFRFKHDMKNNHVWLDLTNNQQKIPLYKDKVVMKATRVSWQESKLHSQYRQKNSTQLENPSKSQQFDFFDHEQKHSEKKSRQDTKFDKKQIPKQVMVNDNKEFNLLDDHHQQKEQGRQENWLHSFGSKENDLI